MVVRVNTGPFREPTPEGAALWGLFTYRVATPFDLFVPSLAHLHYE